MKITILGGGLSAISLTYFLQNRSDIEQIDIIEKNDRLGGICCSFDIHGILYDVGPHIIFSKNKEILDLMNNLLGENINKIRRSNRILHKKCFVQYPFENDLSKLPQNDIDYCVNTFLHNPYENYEVKNMLQFFLKTFGEGITNTYLRPYNEKIWKFDSSFMDTQMVERIPKPSQEDILRSAAGETIDGYLHQLYFTYPKTGGTEALIKAFISKFNDKVKIHTNSEVQAVEKASDGYNIMTESGNYQAENLVCTMPITRFAHIYKKQSSEFEKQLPQDILNVVDDLKYNSIVIAIVNVKYDKAGDNFAFMVADKKVKFHRLSKLDFLGESYGKKDGSATYMIEITYRKNDLTDKATNEELLMEIYKGLEKIGFIDSENDVKFADIKRFEYAYVIYDLNHRKNMDIIKDYFETEKIYLNGRFGSFEYLNMDAIIAQSKELAEKMGE